MAIGACPADTLPEVMERWKDSIATGNPFEMVFPLRGSDGEFHPFLTRIVPVKDVDGKVTRWFGNQYRHQRAKTDRSRVADEQSAT